MTTQNLLHSLKRRVGNHLRICIRSNTTLLQRPISSVAMTLTVSIAVAFSSILFLTAENISKVSLRWNNEISINLYLHRDVEEEEAIALKNKIAAYDKVAQVAVILASQAFDDFLTISELKQTLKVLKTNPLPHLLIVYPQQTGQAETQELIRTFQSIKQIERIQFDRVWVSRVIKFVALINSLSIVLVALFAVGLIALIGNVIGVMVYQQRDEIRIIQLLGGDDEWLVYPYMYAGFWLSIISTIISLLFIELVIALLQVPVDVLNASYNSNFKISGFSILQIFELFTSIIVITMAAAWSSAKHFIVETDRN